MKPLELTATVQNGHLHLNVREAIVRYLSAFEGRQVSIRIAPPKRSTSANSYYWGYVIRPIWNAFRDAGFAGSQDDVHEHYKRKFIGVDHVEMPDGTEFVKAATSTRLDKQQFQDYIHAIQSDPTIVNLGVFIESPQQYEQRTGQVINGGKIG